MNLVIIKCVTAVILSNFSGHYLRNRSTLDIGVLGYIGIVQHKEHFSWDTLYTGVSNVTGVIIRERDCYGL